jgi:hypothetical protein
VRDPENRAVDAEAEAERHYGGNAEEGSCPQPSKCISNVLRDRGHACSSSPADEQKACRRAKSLCYESFAVFPCRTRERAIVRLWAAASRNRTLARLKRVDESSSSVYLERVETSVEESVL